MEKIDFNAPIEIRDGRNGNWFWVDKEVWQDKRLTSSDKVAYGTLAYFANNKTQKLFPSYTKLEEYSGLSNRQCYYSIKKLEKYKYIIIKRKNGKPNLYTLLDTPAKFAPLQNNTSTPANKHHQPLQNSTTNKNYLTRITNNKEVDKKDYDFLIKFISKQPNISNPTGYLDKIISMYGSKYLPKLKNIEFNKWYNYLNQWTKNKT